MAYLKGRTGHNGDGQMSFARKKDTKSVLGGGIQYLCIFAEQIAY